MSFGGSVCSAAVPDFRPLRERIRTAGDGHRRHAQGNVRVARHPLHLQILIRQGQPLVDPVLSRIGPGRGAAHPVRSKAKIGVPVLTDVHEDTPLNEVAAVVDVLQTPAFLCRQTNFIQNVARAGRPVNIKKGQFLAPWDMQTVVDKARAVGNEQIMVCERGGSFGYNTLVSDMRGLAIMRATQCPVVFDATHSVQQPGGQGATSGGQREFVPVLARAAVASGVAGVFSETHPNPDVALSDGPNAWPLGMMKDLLETLKEIDALVKQRGFIEHKLMKN